jgi:diguanylate cyclase (GGDEF)-like protein
MTTLNLDNVDLGAFGVTDKQPDVEDVVNHQRQKKMNATMNEALKVNPDEQAHINKLSRESGVPAEAVAVDPSDIEHGLKLKNIDVQSMTKLNPTTTKYLNNFDNASIAHDDIDTLVGLENTLKLPSQKQTVDKNSFLGNATRGVAERVTELTGSLYGLASQAGDALDERFPAGGFVFEDSMLPRYAGPDEWKRLQSQGMDDMIDRTGKILKETDFGYVPQATWESTKAAYSEEGVSFNAVGETLAFGFEQGTHSLADMAATMYALPTYILARSQDIGEKRAKNKGQEEATIEETIEAAPFAVASAVLERILPAKVFGGMGKKEVTQIGKEILSQSANKLKQIMKAAGSGLIIEASTEAVQEGIIEYIGERYGTDAPMVLAEALDRAAGGAVGGGVAGAGLSGGFESVNVAVNTVAQNKVNAATDQASNLQVRADQEQRNIDKINEQSENSKLKDRDNDAFKQFVEEADGDNNTTLFIDGVQTRLYLSDKQGQIKSDPALQLLAEKVAEAAALGTDLNIPVSEFAATLAGTEHFTNLRDFMSFSEETQAPFRQEQNQVETQNYITGLVNEAQEASSQYVESQDIFETVRSQLIDTGVVNAQNASVMAQIVPAWATVYAQRNGVSIKEAYEKSGLVIEGPQTGELSRLEASDAILETTISQPVVIDPVQIGERLNQPPVDRRSSDAPVDQDQRQGERRRDTARRDKIAQMTPEEQYAAIYQHELTGLNNRRAFEEDIVESPVVISIDVDSLKATNDNLGHDAGDNLLKSVGKVLHDATGGKAYHISGDEFFVLGDNQADMEQQLVDAQETLKSITVSSGQGSLLGPGFTFGTGTDKASADHAMEQGKAAREEAGERVARGELPAGMTLTEQLKQDGVKDEELKQEPEQGITRGFYDPANSVIRLTEAADLSTFLHEFAHFMYEMELTGDKTNPDSINTIEGIHNWYKRNAEAVAVEARKHKPNVHFTSESVVEFLDNGTTGNADRDSGIRRAVHEQFARGFETYVMEGKAPSSELRNAFRTFARWLTQIYRSVRGDLKVNLDEQMREVFARLLATEEQINAAESRAQYQPMFNDAAMAGMTDEEFKKYQEQVTKVKDVQSETLRNKLIKELTRQTKTWWKEEKADIVDEQLETLKTEPVYRAREALKDGALKLDHATVKEMIGEQRTDKRGRKSTRIPPVMKGMTVAGAKGVHPDEAAAFFGYGSGSELLSDLTDAVPIKIKAEANAEEQMLNKYGDMLRDGTIEAQADEAVQNEERGKLILDELKALRKGNAAAPALDRATVKQMAEENIAKLSFRQIHPGKYRKAEIRAAQESATALANGDKDLAARAKARQVLNYYLGMAATNARADTVKIVDRMARYNKKSVREEIMKADNGYWEQIVKILNRFEFRKATPLKAVDQQNQDINTWSKERMGIDGDALVLSPVVMNESFVTHWKNIPFSDLQGVNDSVKNIEHVAKYSNKLTRMGEEIEFKKLVQRWTDHMSASSKSKFKSQRTDVIEGRKWGRWAMAQMTKIPFMASWLDGGERAGMSHEILVQPFTDAYNTEINLWKDVGKVVMDAIENRSKEDIKRHNRKIFIPELKDDNNDGNVFGNQIIAVALNTGNAGNLKKMLLGEGWANPDDETTVNINNPKLQAALSKMTKSDWELVQLIWDQMELLYPQLSEVHRRTTGLTPPKVAATPVSTQFGEFKGGYYPVKYDPNRSQKAQENEDRLNAETESMFSNSSSIHSSVTAGATNERTQYYAPIRLSLDVVPAHFQEAIHFITHHDPVRQTNKLIRNPEVASVIKEKLGPEEYAQLNPWLNDIAKDGRETPTKMFWDDMIGKLRFGITLGTMGFKASTGIIQISGLSNTIAELGIGPVYKSMRSILGSPQNMKDAWEFASSNSKVLSHRVQTMDREIKNAMKRLEGKRGVLPAVQELSMKHIALIQTYMVDLPSWQAAYIKELETSGDEQKAYARADWTIENIQGSGATKDLARIMRGQSETGRMLTMFMTFFSSLWNMERDLVKGTRSGRYSITSVGAKLAFLFTIPVLFEMLMRGELGDEDDTPEEQLQKMLTKVAMYPVASVPFVRDAASAVTGDFGYNMSPVASLMEQGTRSIPALIEGALTDEEITKGQAKGATKFIGATLGVPGTGQAWASGEHLFDVIEEGEEFTMHQLLFGPKRD